MPHDGPIWIIEHKGEKFHPSSILRMKDGKVEQMCWNYSPKSGKKRVKWFALEELPKFGEFVPGILRPELNNEAERDRDAGALQEHD